MPENGLTRCSTVAPAEPGRPEPSTQGHPRTPPQLRGPSSRCAAGEQQHAEGVLPNGGGLTAAARRRPRRRPREGHELRRPNYACRSAESDPWRRESRTNRSVSPFSESVSGRLDGRDRRSSRSVAAKHLAGRIARWPTRTFRPAEPWRQTEACPRRLSCAALGAGDRLRPVSWVSQCEQIRNREPTNVPRRP